MITLRCTQKAAKALGFAPHPNVRAGTSPLGDWYVNLVATVGGGAFLFMNEQSLLAVVVPRGTPDLLNVFIARVANVLSMIGVPNARIEHELVHFQEARVAPTNSKRLLGVLNDLALHLQLAVEDATPQDKLSLSDFELELATMPHATLAWRTASEMALELLNSPAQFGVA